MRLEDYIEKYGEELGKIKYENHMKDRFCKNSKWHKRSLENA